MRELRRSSPRSVAGEADRRLHIGYLIQQFPPEVGAGPARVTELSARWLAAGADVSVVTAMPSRVVPGTVYGAGDPRYHGRWFLAEDWCDVRVLRSWAYSSPKGGFARTLANNASFAVTAAMHSLARLGRPDVLIASSPPFLPHLAGRLVSRWRRVPLVLEVRDLWPDYLVGMGVLPDGGAAARALFALERRLLLAADRVVVVTESFRRRIEQKGVPAGRIEVIPNGVDMAQYYPAREAPPLKALQRQGSEFLIGYLGNFGASQDLGSVVAAARILADEGVPVRFVLVGDGTEREKLLAAVAALRPPNLTVHPPIPKESTRAFYGSCDVCLVPLAATPVLQETIPSKLFEVMACGRPVLASLAGEGARIIEQSGAGVAVAPGDAHAIADGIRRLRAMEPDGLAAIQRDARQHVAEHYNRDILAETYLQLLRDVAGEAAAGQAARAGQLLP